MAVIRGTNWLRPEAGPSQDLLLQDRHTRRGDVAERR
jgi:hypothetical protein